MFSLGEPLFREELVTHISKKRANRATGHKAIRVVHVLFTAFAQISGRRCCQYGREVGDVRREQDLLERCPGILELQGLAGCMQ